jgi:hypothetical protein
MVFNATFNNIKKKTPLVFVHLIIVLSVLWCPFDIFKLLLNSYTQHTINQP